MKVQTTVIGLLLLVVLGVPFLLSAGKTGSSHDKDLRTLIVVTPHVPQIRDEFARGFAAWHEREYGEGVSLDYRTPGGTSEIRKQLSAMFKESVKKLISRTSFSLKGGGWYSDHYGLKSGGGSSSSDSSGSSGSSGSSSSGD